MCSLLIIYLLTVESSYLRNTERPALHSRDTVQYCLSQGNGFRVRTYALDKDVHIYSIGQVTEKSLEDLAEANTQKHYGDVILEKIKLVSIGGLDGLKLQMTKRGLSQEFEIKTDGSFAFWSPEPLGTYKTRSEPVK